MNDAPRRNEVLTAAELQRLDRLRIRRRRTVRGEGTGEWRSHQYGTSGLFADHRPYVAGDDLRYVDWNVYGRLGELFVKRFEAEESMNLLLCLDRSLSMSGEKARVGRRVAAALGYLSLAHNDRVLLSWLPNRDPVRLSAYRGSGRIRLFLDDLAETEDAGTTDHVRDLGRIATAVRTRGLAVLVSDFFDPGGAIRGLALLRAHGLDVGALHVVDPADATLPVGTSIVAVDRETGDHMRVDVTPAVAERVHRAWQQRADGLERWCLAREIRYLRADTRQSLWETLRGLFQAREGLGV